MKSIAGFRGGLLQYSINNLRKLHDPTTAMPGSKMHQAGSRLCYWHARHSS